MVSRRGPQVGGLVAMIAGATLIGATLLTMNRKVHRSDEVRATVIADLKVEKKKRPPPPAKAPRARPRPKRASRRAPAPPAIASNLSGLGVGLDLFQSDGLQGLADDVLSDKGLTEDMVLNEEAVDRMPRPHSGNTPPKYPPRARAKGITGRVVLNLVVSADGTVKQVSVYSSEPPGVFDEAVLSAARQWRFEPALYRGQPVQMAFKLPLAFALD